MAELRVERAGVGVQRRLAGQVGGEQRNRHLGGQGGGVHHLAAALLQEARYQPHGHAHRADVVELHGALVVVDAVQRLEDGAADRVGGVVDQGVHPRMLMQDSVQAGGDAVRVGQVGGVDPGPAAFAVDVVLHPFQFLFPARHQAQSGAARGQLFGRFLADAAGGTGEHDGHTLKAHRTSSR